jgi:hypothetical protein
MDPETLTTDTQPTDAEAQQPITPDVAVNTEPADERMIPKTRFDEVNNELKRIKAEQAKATKAAEEAQRKAAEEQGEYRKLYEAEKASREAAIAEMKAIQVKNLKHQIAADVGLPNGLASRLQGETEEEIKADAEALLATLPKTTAPKLDGGAGGVRTDKPAKSEDEIKELAALYGVSVEHLRNQFIKGA